MLHKRSTIVATGGSLAAFLVSHQAPIGVDGHAYIMGPVSRQYWNSQVFQKEDYPNLEECPQCYNAGGEVTVRKRGIEKTDPAVLAEYGNGYYPLRWVYDKGEMADNGNYIEPQAISVRHGVCGDPRQSEDESWNEYGTPNSEWPILGEYTEGQNIEIKAVMSAYHWGHLEYFICNADDLEDSEGVVTQECFNMHPLTRAAGDDVNSPIDPNFSGRYYCDPECREKETDQTHDNRSAGGYVMTMNYQLPKGLTCKRCILQMVYFTGHKCRHPGYEEFNPPSWPGECAPNKEDWITLEPDYCGDKEWIYSEEFWGCADFSIMAGGV